MPSPMPIRIGIADQGIALPYLEAVRPAVGVEFGQGPQERVGEPARLAASPQQRHGWTRA